MSHQCETCSQLSLQISQRTFTFNLFDFVKIEFLQKLPKINWIFLEPRCEGDYGGGLSKLRIMIFFVGRAIANNDALVRNNISSLFPQTIGATEKIAFLKRQTLGKNWPASSVSKKSFKSKSFVTGFPDRDVHTNLCTNYFPYMRIFYHFSPKIKYLSFSF